jgi:hypothetical protein
MVDKNVGRGLPRAGHEQLDFLARVIQFAAIGSIDGNGGMQAVAVAKFSDRGPVRIGIKIRNDQIAIRRDRYPRWEFEFNPARKFPNVGRKAGAI